MATRKQALGIPTPQALRERAGLTPEQIDARLDGVNPQTLEKVEKGVEGVSTRTLRKLAAIYGVEIDVMAAAYFAACGRGAA